MEQHYIIMRDYHNGLAAVENYSHLWGFVNENDEEVILCKYQAVRDFSEGFAGVYNGRACGFINREGVLVIPCIYETQQRRPNIKYKWWGVGDFHEGLAPACRVITIFNSYMRARFIDKDIWGYIDIKGNEAINFKYYSVDNFKDGRANVAIDFGVNGIINQDGNEIVPCRYNTIGAYSDGLALVNKNSYERKYGYIDKNGAEIIPCQYYVARPFSEGLAVVISEPGKNEFRIIDTSGNTVFFSKVYNDAQMFSEGLLPVMKNDKWGFIDKDGVDKIPFKYDSAECFKYGISKVKLCGIDGIIDRKGRSVVIHDEVELHKNIDIVGEFRSGYALINHKGKYGLIDNNGSFVVDPHYDFIGNLFDSLLKVSIGGMWDHGGFGDPNRYYINGKYGLIDISGVEIAPCIYNLISEYDGSFYRAERDNIFFLIDNIGKVRKYVKKDWLCLNMNNIDKMSNLIYELIHKELGFFSQSQLMKLIQENIIHSQKTFNQLSDEAIMQYISNINITEIINSYTIFVNAGRACQPGDKSDDVWIELVSITGDKKPNYYAHRLHEAVYNYNGDVYLESLLPYYFESIFSDHGYGVGSGFQGFFIDR